MLRVKYARMQKLVKGVVELRILELMIQHQDEETVQREDGGQAIIAVAHATLERRGEILSESQRGWADIITQHIRRQMLQHAPLRPRWYIGQTQHGKPCLLMSVAMFVRLLPRDELRLFKAFGRISIKSLLAPFL